MKQGCVLLNDPARFIDTISLSIYMQAMRELGIERRLLAAVPVQAWLAPSPDFPRLLSFVPHRENSVTGGGVFILIDDQYI